MSSGLFGELHENAFLVFSRANKRLYAKVILEIYREFFGTLHIRIAPRRAEICDFIASILTKHPELWTENEEILSLPDTAGRRGRIRRRKRIDTETRDPVALKADHVYARLIDCGWLEEDQIGFVTIAEMPPAAQAMAERFHEIDQGLSQFLGGVVIEIRNALHQLKARPEENALGLKQAVESAAGFIRRLRAIHASLRAIERDIIGSSDLKTRIRTFFEDFLGRILIQDFKAILTTNHPYRFKSEIISLADQLSLDRLVIAEAASGYVASQVCETTEAAELLVVAHLEQLHDAFDSIDDAFRRINDFRMRLENRLRNTIRYMERADSQATARLIEAIKSVAGTEDAREAKAAEPLRYPGLLSIQAARLDPGDGLDRRGSLAVPPAPRTPIVDDVLPSRTRDPAIAKLREIEQLWLAKSDPDIKAVDDWLDRKIRPGETIQSTLMHIGDLRELFLFVKAKNLLSAGGLPGYESRRTETRRSDDWLDTQNFTLTRKTKARQS